MRLRLSQSAKTESDLGTAAKGGRDLRGPQERIERVGVASEEGPKNAVSGLGWTPPTPERVTVGRRHPAKDRHKVANGGHPGETPAKFLWIAKGCK